MNLSSTRSLKQKKNNRQKAVVENKQQIVQDKEHFAGFFCIFFCLSCFYIFFYFYIFILCLWCRLFSIYCVFGFVLLSLFYICENVRVCVVVIHSLCRLVFGVHKLAQHRDNVPRIDAVAVREA